MKMERVSNIILVGKNYKSHWKERRHALRLENTNSIRGARHDPHCSEMDGQSLCDGTLILLDHSNFRVSYTRQD